MKRLLESKLAAWVAMLLVVVLVVAVSLLRMPWWVFIAVFFCFISAFAHIAAIYLRRMSMWASGRLDFCALVCLVMAVIAFVGEFIMLNCI